MNSLDKTIVEISERFLSEAKNSLSLVEDMAAMERYMAESYSGRIFIELIQNADDCQSTRINLSQIGDDLYFVNNGKAFCTEDILSISRSGSSMKKRGESIGYRGVGFKSTTALSSDIYIYSGGSTFSFSKNIAAQKLGLNANRVPTVRIPFLVSDVDAKTEKEIHKFIEQGYTTVFIFKNANIMKLEDEIKDFSSDLFIFLRYIQECFICIEGCSTQNYVMQRTEENEFSRFTIDEVSWKIVRSKSAALAFKEENGKIINCDEKEAVYHCFLPTLDRSPFDFKINADFSTDPSRKHLVNDEITEAAIDDLSSLICELVERILSGILKVDTQMLSLLRGRKNFSSTNQRVMSKLKKKIVDVIIKVNDGTEIPIAQYKNLPEWLEPQEKEIIRGFSKTIHGSSLPIEIYKNNFQVEEFLADYSSMEYTNEELIQILEEDILDKLPKETIAKLSVKIIKKSSLNQRLYGKRTNIEEAINNIGKIQNGAEILETLTKDLSTSELRYVNENTNVNLEKKEESFDTIVHDVPKVLFTNATSHKIKSSKPKVTKWRSAEQRVVQLERFMGYSVQDVSRMNVGYDIESTTSSGEKRYIEVKSLTNENAEFTITNNEYTAAHQYGNNYYICLVFDNKAIYIQNPLNKLAFTKRIRQWEWVCDQYYGTEVFYDVE